jgi:PAS domain S-box-containing protein
MNEHFLETFTIITLPIIFSHEWITLSLLSILVLLFILMVKKNIKANRKALNAEIADRQKLQIEIMESEQRFKTFFQSSPICTSISRLSDGEFYDVNKAFIDLCGYTRHEIIGHTSKELNLWVNPNDRFRVIDMLQIQHNVPGFKTSFKTKAGQIREGILSTEIIYISEQKYLLALFTDVTEQNKTQQFTMKQRAEFETLNKELKLAKEKAEESDRLKIAFLSNMSHEIRTPMNAILGFSELLSKPGITDENKARFSGLMKERSHDLLRIIEDIIDISKIEIGQMRLFETHGHVESLLKDIFEYYQYRKNNMKKDMEIDLVLLCDDTLKDVYIEIDGQRFRQILINLLDNSFKFTKKGKINIGCYLRDQSEIIFFVSDTGIGIPNEKQQIVFENFRQAEDMFSTRNFGGTGLGLSIAKGLSELMGGRLWFESTEQVGTTFYFSLPFKSSPEIKKQVAAT